MTAASIGAADPLEAARREYQEDVAAIVGSTPKGITREWLKRARWEKFAVLEFEVGGESLRLVVQLQEKFAVGYFRLVAQFYRGEVEEEDYRMRRLGLLRNYAQRLQELGLVVAVFDAAWVRDFARDSLLEERRLLPVPRVRTVFTDADAAVLCVPLRDYSKRFFRAVHRDFGAGRLRREPDLFAGIDLPEKLEP